MSIPYRLIRSNRRTLAIEVRPDGDVIVRAPFIMPRFVVESFVAQREAWIRKSLAKYAERPSEPELTKEETERLRKLAKAYIPPRIEYYANLMGVRPTAVRYTSAKTRWGSCSPKNSLAFSVRLMRKPPEAIDYVVVHELAHIREHNHSKRFWAIVAKYMPDWRERRKLLK
ncbi:MAG: M48 family metallopeptidase [Firmicutes bacterium]|nr:M48 family metallopeptidase [Bacillota bacterium]